MVRQNAPETTVRQPIIRCVLSPYCIRHHTTPPYQSGWFCCARVCATPLVCAYKRNLFERIEHGSPAHHTTTYTDIHAYRRTPQFGHAWWRNYRVRDITALQCVHHTAHTTQHTSTPIYIRMSPRHSIHIARAHSQNKHCRFEWWMWRVAQAPPTTSNSSRQQRQVKQADKTVRRAVSQSGKLAGQLYIHRIQN